MEETTASYCDFCVEMYANPDQATCTRCDRRDAHASVRALVESLPTMFRPNVAAQVGAVIQVHCLGEEAEDWVIRVAHGTAEVHEGTAAAPNLTLTGPTKGMADILSGRLSAFFEMFTKVKVEGDKEYLYSFEYWFRM